MLKKYAQIMLVIKMLLDFEDLSVEEVTGRLKVVQDHEKALHTEPSALGGKLLCKVEQWCTFQNKEDGSRSSKECRGVRTVARRRRRDPGCRAVPMAPPPASARQTGMVPASTAARAGAKDCRLPPHRGGQV
jgi:hypothetical protein